MQDGERSPESSSASIGFIRSPHHADSPPDDGGPRKKRAALAAQACETCRQRKSRCDETRPKCGLCRRLNVECKYREPVPTKKDKSLEIILDQLSRMEAKLEAVYRSTADEKSKKSAYREAAPSVARGTSASASAIMANPNPLDQEYTPRVLLTSRMSTGMTSTPQDLQHIMASQRILLWPSIVEYLRRNCHNSIVDDDLRQLKKSGAPWFLGLDMKKHPETLSSRVGLQSVPITPSRPEELSRVRFTNLRDVDVRRYTETFFATYNVLYPIMDQESFIQEVLADVHIRGFGYGDFNSVLALLVLALGKLAHEGTWASSINPSTDSRSGIRGGTADTPPGIEIFNEARRRLGFLHSQCTLENIQVLLLLAVYYEACSRHVECWRSHTAAAMALLVLLKCEVFDWSSARGQTLRRIYWTCRIIETWYHIDLDLPPTQLAEYEDIVPTPLGRSTGESMNDAQSQFLAMIALCQLCSRVHVTIFEAISSTAETQEDMAAPPVHVINELRDQLDGWRALLPPRLQWLDGSRHDLSTVAPPGDPQFERQQFSSNADEASELQQNATLMGAAQMRSRYYYALFLMYRPFVYKVLHFPSEMSVSEQTCAAHCLQACLLWPIAMRPARESKRLVPYLFAWTQNFLGILLILRMTTENWMLRAIAEKHLARREVEQTVRLLLDWFEDMRRIDGVAEWGWALLQQIFANVLTR